MHNKLALQRRGMNWKCKRGSRSIHQRRKSFFFTFFFININLVANKPFNFSAHYWSHKSLTRKHIFIPSHWDQYDESMIDEAYNSHHHICNDPLKHLLQQLQLRCLQWKTIHGSVCAQNPQEKTWHAHNKHLNTAKTQ